MIVKQLDYTQLYFTINYKVMNWAFVKIRNSKTDIFNE